MSVTLLNRSVKPIIISRPNILSLLSRCQSQKQQQQLQQPVYRRLDAACPSDLPLTVLWILPSAVAAARWAPDMLRTRLHSHSMRSVSLAQSLWFLPVGRLGCWLDVVRVHYSCRWLTPQISKVDWKKSGTPKMTFTFHILSFLLKVGYLTCFAVLVFMLHLHCLQPVTNVVQHVNCRFLTDVKNRPALHPRVGSAHFRFSED